MRIEHVALWTSNLEAMRDFYARHFLARHGERYHNPAKRFQSYFLEFESGARLELMHSPVVDRPAGAPVLGYAHLALSVGSREAVDQMATRLSAAGVPVVDGPRWTGDGYYEVVVLDPDGNRVEITI